MWIPCVLVGAPLLAICRLDLRDRRIPNALNIAVWTGGTALQALAPAGGGLFHAPWVGGTGFIAALQATAVMAALACLLWRMRLFGGGDAKLLIALAPWVGLPGLPLLLTATLICGGVLALAYLAGARLGRGSHLRGNLGTMSRPLRLPYSFAIAAGLGFTVGVTSSGWWSS